MVLAKPSGGRLVWRVATEKRTKTEIAFGVASGENSSAGSNTVDRSVRSSTGVKNFKQNLTYKSTLF